MLYSSAETFIHLLRRLDPVLDCLELIHINSLRIRISMRDYHYVQTLDIDTKARAFCAEAATLKCYASPTFFVTYGQRKEQVKDISKPTITKTKIDDGAEKEKNTLKLFAD